MEPIIAKNFENQDTICYNFYMQLLEKSKTTYKFLSIEDMDLHWSGWLETLLYNNMGES
jgi:hypothetical protein